jgi:predicted phosphoribosyltransferase
MVFKNRKDAAEQLFELLKEDEDLKQECVVVSILRGGAVIGNVLSKKLNAKHMPIVSVKIPAPYNNELAIGAICFDTTFIEQKTITMLNLTKSEIARQVKQAEKKFIDYCRRFNIKEESFDKLKDKNVLITDDGIATGATLKAAIEFIKNKDPQKIILAFPVSPSDITEEGVDKSFVVYKDSSLTAISSYYENFPQIEDKEVKNIIKKNTISQK